VAIERAPEVIIERLAMLLDIYGTVNVLSVVGYTLDVAVNTG
jgi:hypothetical protein